MSILVVGSVAYDTVKTPWGEVRDAVGGSATYFSAAASFFAPVHVVAVIGDDFNREELVFLEKRGVDFKGLQEMPGKTFRWSAEYSQDVNERKTLCTELNVFEQFQPIISDADSRTPYLFLANIDPDLQTRILNQVKSSTFIMSNTIKLWIDTKLDTFLDTLHQVDVLMINDSEAKTLAAETNLVKAGRKILTFGPQRVLITKGEHGVLMLTNDSIFALPAYPKEEVFDPTGAGDSFAGGFMGYLAESGDLGEDALRRATVYGSVVASFTVGDFSVSGLLAADRDAVEERFQNIRNRLRI